MRAPTILAAPECIRLRCARPAADVITLEVYAARVSSCCPNCGAHSVKVHSRYTRSVADLPWQGVAVRLELHTRRFFCLNDECRQRIFCERLPGVVARYARRTVRLNEALRLIGFALGGEAGARTAVGLGLDVSPATLLRRVRQATLPEPVTPRVLGVDDWCKRKGQTYGTILVDLERRRAVDLLPDREAGTLRGWLRGHPGVEVISRDRASCYADGARAGAPQATQVADRFHLMKNLGEALERFFSHQQTAVRAAIRHLAQSFGADQIAALVAALPAGGEARPRPARPRAADSVLRRGREAARERRLARYQEIMRLHQAGLTRREIAGRTGLNLKTVRRYLQADGLPEAASTGPRASKLDRFAAEVERQWLGGCLDATRIWRELKAQGFAGGVDTVRRFVRRLKRGLPEEVRQQLNRHTTGRDVGPAPAGPPSAREMARLCLRPPAQLKEAEKRLLGELISRSPEITAAFAFGQSFARMLRQRAGQEFEAWLPRALRSPVAELRHFAAGLRRDYQAVEAALTLPWSNGQTEGQVGRLKMIKRQMYGRAKFDLLKQRVLHQG
jgi:transposase